MTKVLTGNRVGKQGKLNPGSSAILFDAARARVFLVRREDNGQWTPPGGQMAAGENAQECCEREVFEETGMRVRVTRLIGIYTSPDFLLVYDGGDQIQPLTYCFEVELLEGTFRPTNETTAGEYFSHTEIKSLELFPIAVQPVRDAFAGESAAFIR